MFFLTKHPATACKPAKLSGCCGSLFGHSACYPGLRKRSRNRQCERQSAQNRLEHEVISWTEEKDLRVKQSVDFLIETLQEVERGISAARASKGTAVLSLEELVRSAVAARIHSTNGTLIPVLTMYSEAAAKEGDETAAGMIASIRDEALAHFKLEAAPDPVKKLLSLLLRQQGSAARQAFLDSLHSHDCCAAGEHASSSSARWTTAEELLQQPVEQLRLALEELIIVMESVPEVYDWHLLAQLCLARHDVVAQCRPRSMRTCSGSTSMTGGALPDLSFTGDRELAELLSQVSGASGNVAPGCAVLLQRLACESEPGARLAVLEDAFRSSWENGSAPAPHNGANLTRSSAGGNAGGSDRSTGGSKGRGATLGPSSAIGGEEAAYWEEQRRRLEELVSMEPGCAEGAAWDWPVWHAQRVEAAEQKVLRQLEARGGWAGETVGVGVAEQGGVRPGCFLMTLELVLEEVGRQREAGGGGKEDAGAGTLQSTELEWVLEWLEAVHQDSLTVLSCIAGEEAVEEHQGHQSQ